MSRLGYLAMADPATMGMISMGSSVAGGLLGVKGATTNAEAQRLGIQGRMMETMAQAFGFKTQAQQYGYQSNINKYQAAVAEQNKIISKANASYARDVGEVEAQQSGMKSRRDLGEMIASQGASGLDVNKGTGTKVRESMIDIGYYNQALIRSSAAKKAYGYEVEATEHEAQADVYRYTAQMNEDQAKNALMAADYTMQALPLQQRAMSLADTTESLGIMGSLVSATGSVASKWIQGKNMGMWG
jgi:hypothetical protein